MVIAIAIIAIIAVFAVPSFIEFRERAVIRGSAEQLVTSVAQFRHEGIKRNRFVTVTFLGDVGSDAWCVGAEEGLDAACDCTAEDSCSVGRFPESVSERRGTTLTARSGFSDDDAATFDPSTGTLTELGSGGSITLRSPSERIDYRLRFDLNPLGRATLCVPGDARALPGYQPCGD
ncbi:MAG TPA: GspH/FimT family protein [Xanthomonadaceae bacterium]|nr:GspH/FimT family protein [Xanthomonadaceae bacterium]